MEISEKFILVYQPTNFQVEDIRVHRVKKGFMLYSSVSGTYSDSFAETEYEMWEQLAKLDVEAQLKLEKGTVFRQVLARRMELVLGLGQAAMSSKLGELHEEVSSLHGHVLRHLGVFTSKLENVFNGKPSRSLAWLTLRNKFELPFEAEKTLITGRYLPDVAQTNGWVCRPIILCTNSQSFEYVTQRQLCLGEMLGSHGMTLCDLPYGFYTDL